MLSYCWGMWEHEQKQEPVHPHCPPSPQYLSPSHPTPNVQLIAIDRSCESCTGNESTLQAETRIGTIWPSNCIFPSPFASSRLISRTVSLVDVGDLGNKWVIRIWVGKHGTDGEENFKNISKANIKIGLQTNLWRWSMQDSIDHGEYPNRYCRWN
jgi:hypothetical protein